MAITSEFNSELYFIPTCHFVFKSLSKEWNKTTMKHLIAVNLLDIHFSIFNNSYTADLIATFPFQTLKDKEAV